MDIIYRKRKDFFAASARLSRTSAVAFLNVFSGHEYRNVDTLSVQNPFTNPLNLSVNAGYHISQKWYVGLNIELAGFTFGNTSIATLHANGVPPENQTLNTRLFCDIFDKKSQFTG